MAEFRRDRSQLDSALDGLVPEPGAPRPKRARLPLGRMRWRRIGRPGGYRHATLEEARALRWAVAQQALFKGETNVRCLHPVDNATCVGAAVGGRSEPFVLNGEMQKIAAM